MPTLSSAQRSELGLIKARETHFRLLEWLREQSGTPSRGGSRKRTEHDSAIEDRFLDLLRYRAIRWRRLTTDPAAPWYPPVKWSTTRFLGRMATRSEQTSWPRALAGLEHRGLVACSGVTVGGHRRTNAVRLTTKGVDARRAVAAARGETLDTQALYYDPFEHRYEPDFETPSDEARYYNRKQVTLERVFRERALALRKELDQLAADGEPAPQLMVANRSLFGRGYLQGFVDLEEWADRLERKMGWST